MATEGDSADTATGLAAEIAAVYAAPLEEFVARRNALTKALRSAGRREDARAIKALRKPRRLAWALDLAATSDRGAVDAVADAVAASVEAQAGRGDLRDSLGTLRQAVAGLAANASRLARELDQTIDAGELANAIMAVIGTRGSFELLRAGRLVDIPEAGGIELLTVAQPPHPGHRDVETAPAGEPSAAELATETPAGPDPAAVEALQRAEGALVSARKRLESLEETLGRAEEAATAADETVTAAETAVATARRRLGAAQDVALAKRHDRDRLRTEMERTNAAVLEAEKAVLRARRDLSTND